ncbi:MAG TPA: PAS domain-containing sensor histidine kinase [Candidatus Dormibacteraeota bacterium]
MPWREWVALGLTVGAGALLVLGIVSAERSGNAFLGVLATLTFVLVVASQVLLRAEMQARLAESRKHWFSSSPRGLAEMDVNLKIVEGNGRLASLLATDELDLAGSLLTRFFPPEEAAGIVAQFKSLLSGAVNTIESDSLGIRADGVRLWLHWRATAVRRQNGAFGYFVITFEDTTQKHAAELAALANLAELEKLNHLKSEFTSMVSHEFRTALTGIQGMSELINGGNIEAAEVQEYSGYILKEAERVNRLITDMLDLDRLEAGKMTMRMQPVDLNATIENVVERTRAVSTTHEFATQLASGELVVVGDADRLIQVLSNLISNAVKYSPKGSQILITSRLADDGAEVSVTDHGIGIPAEFIDQLFGRFERYEQNPGKVIGTGLGLAITRQIVQMHRGRIWVERAQGGGSVFSFAIPVHPAPGTPAPKKAATAV